jgi:hypothetical protein
MKTVRARALLALTTLGATGCSLLVQPNEARLRDGGSSTGDIIAPPGDVLVMDGPAADTALEDVARPDVPTPVDVPTPPTDVPTDTPSSCALGCNDGVDCTDDRCNESLGRCEFTPNPTRCAMGLVCNPEMGGCVAIACTNNAQCDDGNACNGAETCVMGRCQGGTPLTCDDGDACNGIETCDPRMGCQRGTALRCDDGIFCNGMEICDRARGCVSGTPVLCNDGVSCTVDNCNEARRACEFVPDGMRCAAGQVCNPMTGCVTMGCSNNAQCDDGNVCNGAETCVAGVCNAGTPLRCDDGNRCNGTETCDPRMGCRPGMPLLCDDGQLCNGTETCNPATGCVAGTPPNCRDGNVCTADACNPSGNMGRGACVNTPIDADGDGYPAAMVGGTRCTGTDCDDSDRAVNPGAREVCNGRDDNCNMTIDEGLMCGGAPPNDLCENAQAITLNGVAETVTVMGTTAMATHQVGSRCGGEAQPDVFYAITLPAMADLRIEASSALSSGIDPILQYVGTNCPTGGGSSILACNDDQRRGTQASRLWLRAPSIVAGLRRTVIIAVDSYSATTGAFTLTLTTSPAAPSGGCGTRFDLSSGGTVYHVVNPQPGTLSASCSPGGYMILGEQGYVYSGATSGGRITGSATGFRPLVTVRDTSNCNNERDCAYNGMNTVTLNTTQMQGAIVIDGIPNTGMSAYQYAIEFYP